MYNEESEKKKKYLYDAKLENSFEMLLLMELFGMEHYRKRKLK